MEPRTGPAQLVVVGASAGGIETFERLLGQLPADFPVPIILAQHSNRNRASRLAEILGRHGGLAAHALEGTQVLQPATVYVLPPGYGLDMTESAVTVHPDRSPGPTPSIDRLFSKAAVVYGEGLVAVILSGTGSDGADGARMISSHGGLVIIEDPATARYPGMPQSLAHSTVDIVADLDRIGPILTTLVDSSAPTGHGAERDLSGLLDRVYSRSGIDFNGYRRPTIERRLRQRMAATDTHSLRDYLVYLESNPEEYQRLVASFLIKVTNFFRDPVIYGHLAEAILPEVVARARAFGNEIRVWSAGCAKGEEAYSLAILLCEALGDEVERFHIRLFATDVDNNAVAFARRGVYPASALASVDPEVVARYFRREGGQFVAGNRLRGLIVFGQHDLGNRPPFPRTDLILCRNVLIYFTPEMQQRALQLFAFSLRAGGYLVLGKAETVSPASEFFQADSQALKVYRRMGGSVLIPPARRQPAAGLRAASASHGAKAQSESVPEVAATMASDAMEKLAAIAFQVPVGIAIVDAHYDILHVNAAARALLGIHTPAIGEDLVHLAPAIAQNVLLSMIEDATRRGQARYASGVVLPESGTSPRRVVDIACQPLPAEPDLPPHLASVAVTDVTRYADRNDKLRQRLQRVQPRMARMKGAVAALKAANEQLVSENATLRAANATIAAGHEEVQAASDEVETLNEELQATNEELETLNEELQATVEELNASYEDMQARHGQMQEAVTAGVVARQTTELARDRLEVVLASIPVAVLVVDGDGGVVRSNAAGESFMQRAATAQAADLTGAVLGPEDLPVRRASRGEPFRMEFTLVQPEGDTAWYQAIGNPFLDQGSPAGVVAIQDVTDTARRQLQEEFVATASHELRTPLAAMRLYVDTLTRRNTDPGLSGIVEGLDANMRRLSLLVNDLTDSVRLQNGRLTLHRQHIDLGEIIAATVAISQQMAKGQVLVADLPEAPVRVCADPSRIEQVLSNLLDNALRYASASPRVEVRLRVLGQWAQIEVEDHGPGIPEVELPRLFTRFYHATDDGRRRGGGLGLGLYIVHAVVAAHGGEVSVRSRQGEGSVFTVRLPLQAPLQA